MDLADGSWDDVDVEFFGEILVLGQVGERFSTGAHPVWVLGTP